MNALTAVPRARNTDPSTSHVAAGRVQRFCTTHIDKIVSCLVFHGDKTAAEIAACTGLTVVQIDRRLPELERKGVVCVAKADGADLVRNGFRVWRAA